MKQSNRFDVESQSFDGESNVLWDRILQEVPSETESVAEAINSGDDGKRLVFLL